MRTRKSNFFAKAGKWLLVGLAAVGLTTFAAAQSEAPAPPPPPPHDMNVTFGAGPGGASQSQWLMTEWKRTNWLKVCR